MDKQRYPSWLKSPRMGFLYRSVLFIAWTFFRLFYRHKVYGQEHYYDGGGILACNHVSNWDPPIVAISWCDEVHFLAKEELFKFKPFAWFIRSLNAHPVSGDASDVAVLKLTCKLLERGETVVLFPEGSRSFDNVLGPIKPGMGMLSLRTKSAIIPAYVHGTYEIWGRDRKFPKLFGKTACVFGSTILMDEYLAMDKKEAQKAIADRLHSAINGLRDWYEAGAKGTPP